MAKRSAISKDLQAYHGIKRLMLTRQFVPGQKIVYRDLEDLLGMSKTPIVNALVRLERENLVVSHHNRGYYVRKLTDTEVRQIWELKEKLQDILVDCAVRRWRENDLVKVQQALNDYLAHDGELYDPTRFELDNRFHTAIARMGGNDFLTSVLIQLYELSAIGLNLFALTPLIARFKRDHELIFRAIQAKNAKETKKLLRSHDRAGGKALIQAMKQ